MAGEGGGVLAVVQGLRDAGLAVTVVSRGYRAPGGLPDVLGIQGPSQASQTTVDAVTETAFSHVDARLRSSHQSPAWSACMSPLERFPLVTSDIQPYRSFIYSRSHDEEAFVDSLRKYPVSPVRSRSADLIQRILSYTQSKNCAKYTNSRAAKSLPSKEGGTYTNAEEQEVPTRDSGITANERPTPGHKRDVDLRPTFIRTSKSRYDDHIGMYDYLKGGRQKRIRGADVRYLTSVKQCLRERLRQICDDNSTTVCPKIQSRYNHHKTHYHRNTPWKDHGLKDTTIQVSLPSEGPSGSATPGDKTREKRSSVIKHNKACFCERPAPCVCPPKPSRSILKTKLSISPEDLIAEADTHWHCTSKLTEKVIDKISKEEYLKKRLEEKVKEWLEEVPVYANQSVKDRIKREEIITGLTDALNKLPKDDDFLTKAEEEIKKCLRVLPMWRPEKTQDQDVIVDQLCYSLLQRLKDIDSLENNIKDEISKWVNSIPFTDTSNKDKVINDLFEKLKPIVANRSFNDKRYKEDLKSEVVDMLKGLPLEVNGSKSQVINDLADKLVENLLAIPIDELSSSVSKKPNLRNCVLDWIKDIPLDLDLDKDAASVDDLITKLNRLQSENPEDLQEQMDYEITNWLNSVEKKKECKIDSCTKKMLTEKLIDKLVKDRKADDLDSWENLMELLKIWFSDIKDLSGGNALEDEKDLEILAKKLQELKGEMNEDIRQSGMRKAILNWLQTTQKKRGKYIDPGTQENLVNKLLGAIKDDARRKSQLKSEFTKNIWDWLESLPNYKQSNASQYRDMVTQFADKLQSIVSKTGELNGNDFEETVKKWIDELSEKGLEIDSRDVRKLEQQLLSSVSDVKKRNVGDRPKSLKESIMMDVSSVFEQFQLSLSEKDKNSLKDQIAKVLERNWDAIHSSYIEEPFLEIKSLLKKKTALSDNEIEKLAHSLIERAKESTFDISTSNKPLILDRSLKDKLRSNVENILKSIKLPFSDKKRVIDTITDALTDSYLEDDDSYYDKIYEVLKDADIPEREAKDLLNKILDMSNEFQNEVRELSHDTTHESVSHGSDESIWKQKQMFMQRLEREITNFMDKILSESSSFFRDQRPDDFSIAIEDYKTLQEDSSNQFSRFKNQPVKTSTPRKSRNDTNAEREATGFIGIMRESQSELKSANEIEYKIVMKDKIRIWIDHLKLDESVDEKFKEHMANDIATDIIDRQRYIQLSKTKSSNHDEIEHLKYQIFKWVSKLPNQNDVGTTTSKVKVLMESIRKIQVPNLVGDTSKKEETELSSISSVDNDNFLTQDTDEFLEENILGALLDWMNEISYFKPRSSHEKRKQDTLISDLSKELKNIFTSQLKKKEDLEKLCKDVTIDYLKKLKEGSNTDEFYQNTARKLIEHLKNLQFIKDIINLYVDVLSENEKNVRKTEAIKNAVKAWCKKLPLQKDANNNEIREVIDSLADSISRYLLITEINDLGTFMDDILKNLKKLPLEISKEDSKNVPVLTEKLIETLKDVLNDSEKYLSSDSIQRPKKAAEVMYDNIEKWCESLPLPASTPEDMDKANMTKKHLASKLLQKIGELNLNPEIFNDDFLYQEILKDEIDQILDTIPKTPELEKQLPKLKENLIREIMEAKEGMKDELAGFAYKQQLRDAISKTLSDIGLPEMEETSFEVLKDNLADAFISLHYIEDDGELRRLFKVKIFDKINNFCNDYLKRYPSTPLNPAQLNQDLYNALRKVPPPKEESMRREAEQIKIKDVINDWFKDLPIKDSQSNAQRTKMISVLAKRLHEIENDEFGATDTDEMMKNEISKWLNKFSIKDTSTQEKAAKNLVGILKRTKGSRKLDDTTVRKSINFADLTSELSDSTAQFPRQFPQSRLSAEDRAHLQKIKDRSPRVSKPDNKDASVSPLPIAAGIQTDKGPDNFIFQKISQNASIQTLVREPEQPMHVTPQVIVKEYYWDSSPSPNIDRSGSLSSYTPPPANQPASMRQQATTAPDISKATSASQTIPLIQSTKAVSSIRQSIEQTLEQTLNGSKLSRHHAVAPPATPANSQVTQGILDDTLRVTSLQKPGKSCHPCRVRPELSGYMTDNQDAGAYQEAPPQMTSEGKDSGKCRPECTSKGLSDDRFPILDDVQPCFRRRIYESPERDGMRLKGKGKGNQRCSCKSHHLTKCTVRPVDASCQLSHRSCNTLKPCPKCWDGYCPHPSYLYFRRD